MWVAELQQGLKGLNLICSMIFFFFFKKPFPSCPETVYFLGILQDSGRCLFFEAFPVSKFIFGLGRVGRGGGCWGGVWWPRPSDLSFWLLVQDCWRWQLGAVAAGWPVRLGQGVGSWAPAAGLSWRVRGIRDPNPTSAQMGQQTGRVKLVVMQAALIYIKVFKNRSKIAC